MYDLDLFIIVKILRRRLKPCCDINKQPLFAVTRRNLKLADLIKLARAIAEFFFKLARGGLFRRVPLLDSARSYFERVAIERITPLPNERNRAVIKQRQRARAPVVMNDFYINLSAARRLIAAYREAENFALMNVFAFYQFVGHLILSL